MASPNVAEESNSAKKLAQMLGSSIGVGPKTALSGSLSRPSASDSAPLPNTMPIDLLAYSFRIDCKGQIVTVDASGSASYAEVFEKAIGMLNEKSRKEALDKFLFYKDTGIFVPHFRRIDSMLLTPEPGECIELCLKKMDKKGFPVIVSFDGKQETIEANSNTLVQGIIQLLPRKDADDDYLTLYNKKGKIDIRDKVINYIKKDESLEAKVDQERKDMGATGQSKKKNRKSLAPKRTITPNSSISPSSSGSNLSTKGEGKKVLGQFLLNRPSAADLQKKNILVEVKSDSKTTAAAAVDPNSALPLKLPIFIQLGEYLKRHLDLIGLFRVSGDVEHVKDFFASFWTTINWDLAASDPHITSSALKLYLRKQLDPLIPFANYAEFLAAQKLEDEESQIAAIKLAVSKLAEPNASILHYLIHLLTLVAAKEDINKMNPINIGIVFGPTIMWDPKPSVMDYSSTGYQSSLVSNMIVHYKDIWDSDPPSDNQVPSSTIGSSPASTPDQTPVLNHSPSQAAPIQTTGPSRPMPPMPPQSSPPVQQSSVPLIPRSPSANLLPKRPSPMPPKLPPGPPPLSSAGSSPTIDSPLGASGQASPDSRAFNRKSLPPSMPPPTLLPMFAALPVVNETSEASRPKSMPPSHPSSVKAAETFGKIAEEVRDSLIIGSCPVATSTGSDVAGLQAMLKDLSKEELIKHMTMLLGAFAGK